MKAVSIVRERGQLTIPDSIRKIVGWINPLSAVSISVVRPDKIVISPHQTIVDTKTIWDKIHNSRSIAGKGSKSGASFLENDRNSH